MIRSAITFVVLFALLAATRTLAMETDQFNLPPEPLADIAPEVEAYVAQHVQTAIETVNTQIAAHEACVGSEAEPRPKTCGTNKQERSKLDQLRSPDAVAKAVYDQLGAGSIFITKTGTWLNSHKFEHEPSRYKAPYTESIYWERPINYATLSPTIRMYGVEFGTDKLDHLFQQGYTYYRKYTAALKEGKTEAEAIKAAVDYGRTSENLFFGYAVSGVYSNADLAANIAGLHFYKGLANDAHLADGAWRLNGAQPSRLQPYLTEHLNEAYNPSNYLPLLFPLIKSAVKTRACSKWHAAFPTLTADALKVRSAALTTWKGLEYGYKQTARQPHLADLCFAGPSEPMKR